MTTREKLRELYGTKKTPVKTIETDTRRKLRELYEVKPELPEKKVDFVQDIAQDIAKPFLMTGVAIDSVIRIFPRILSAGIAKLKKNEKEVERQWKLIDKELFKVPTKFGYLGEVERAQTLKETAGMGLEMGAWLIPAAKLSKLPAIIKPTAATIRTLSKPGAKVFATGFSFGAGRELREGKSVSDAVKTGVLTGAVGFGLNKIVTRAVSGATNLLKKPAYNPTLIKAGKEEEIVMRELGIELGKLPPKLASARGRTLEKVKGVIHEEVDKVLGKDAGGLIDLGIAGAAIFSPVHLTKVMGFKIGYSIFRYLYSPAGQVVLRNAFSNLAQQIVKMEPATRDKLIVPLTIKILDNLIKEIRQKNK